MNEGKSNAPSSDGAEQEHWDLIIEPKNKFFRFDLKELLQYKFMMFLFVRRDFVAQFKQTILGPLWFIIQPVMTSGIFTVIFSEIAHIPTDGVPPFLFNLAGVTLWNYFASCLTGTSNILGGNSGIFGKVYFPRLAVPISVVITRLYTFAIQFVFFLIVYFVLMVNGADLRPNWYLLLVPVMVLHSALLGLGIGLWASALTVKYRDLNQLIGFGVSLAMYATPIFYPLSAVPKSLQWLVSINPMAPVVEIFRFAFTGTGSLPIFEYSISLGVTVVVLFFGMALFHRAERNFIDVA
jgi:lipopolysaccharide transport system permease protein